MNERNDARARPMNEARDSHARPMRGVVQVYVGIGSNLEHPRAQVSEALAELEGLPRSHLSARSRLYETAPQGLARQPDFVNAVARVATELRPMEFLDRLQEIERRHARVRTVPNAPRTLDLDLLLYGDRTIDSPRLQVPHPRMHERAFVLRPLVDIEPQLRIPRRGLARQLLDQCLGQAVRPID